MLKPRRTHSKVLPTSLLFILISGVLSSMTACSTNHHANGKLIQNVSGDFRVGGFLGTSYIVKIKDSVLSYRTHRHGVTSEWQKQTLTAEDTVKLENKLIELDVVNWDKQYRNPI